MAQIDVDKIVQLVERYDNWSARDELSPQKVLYITLCTDSVDNETVLDKDLKSKCLSFESRTCTVNLDFDDKGYLVAIELV